MTDDVDTAQTELDEQLRWGEGRQDRAIARILAWLKPARDRLVTLEADRDQARQAIIDLRQRVKALEDRAP